MVGQYVKNVILKTMCSLGGVINLCKRQPELTEMIMKFAANDRLDLAAEFWFDSVRAEAYEILVRCFHEEVPSVSRDDSGFIARKLLALLEGDLTVACFERAAISCLPGRNSKPSFGL